MSEIRKKILYLEDDEFTRLMVQSQLERTGFSVESFSSYSDLVTAIKEKDYDVILTDLNIGGHDPHDLISNLKTLVSTPVVILSGSDTPVAEADLNISKPFTAEKAEQIVKLLINGSEDVDLSKVYKFACWDEELVVDYVNTFIDNYKKDLLMLKSEVDQGDLIGIKNRAHKMLSSVAYYNNTSLIKLLQNLEINSYHLNNEELGNIFRTIELHSINLIDKIQQKISASSL